MEHTPVLLRESLEYLAIRAEGVYVDATAGLGGHTAAIAERLGTGRVIALDRDADSLELARARCAALADRITFVQSSFAEFSSTLDSLSLPRVDGILADLGVSRYQLTSPERGFSLQAAGPLDMRMDRRQSLTAAAIVNHYPEREIARILEELGEERRRLAEKIARALVRARPIADTAHLARVVASAVPRTGRLHPATRVFQALRMAVNDEPGQLDALLEQAPWRLKAGGRMVVIAFQSLDDRKVKQRFRELARGGGFRILTRHVVKPGEEEVRSNPASRSAVLRALERTGE
ncbi:MAG: 16S rRNA (cytosine(1402)-N(4))-methyltransferase RsmH [Bryobacteraceae bacterium]|nr:16S rRNA (cytosine(1402)-N(4))-methyltransferase RsmH [Bryobacteraceae bacterium]